MSQRKVVWSDFDNALRIPNHRNAIRGMIMESIIEACADSRTILARKVAAITKKVNVEDPLFDQLAADMESADSGEEQEADMKNKASVEDKASAEDSRDVEQAERGDSVQELPKPAPFQAKRKAKLNPKAYLIEKDCEEAVWCFRTEKALWRGETSDQVCLFQIGGYFV